MSSVYILTIIIKSRLECMLIIVSFDVCGQLSLIIGMVFSCCYNDQNYDHFADHVIMLFFDSVYNRKQFCGGLAIIHVPFYSMCMLHVPFPCSMFYIMAG